jgi:hypothetical protein
MVVMSLFKGHVTPKIKAAITGSSINTDIVVIPGGDDLTTAGARCHGEQTLQRPQKAAVL